MKSTAQKRTLATAAALAVAALIAACATLGNLIQPPSFSVAQGRTAELRLVTPSGRSPLGGAAIRIWARVQNPNAFGLGLSALEGSLSLDGTHAANVNFPIGVPLLARQDTVIPLDLTINFSDLPGLANLAARLLTQNTVSYRLDGTVTVDAGVLGQPKFGPSTWLTGSLAVRK